MKKIEYNECSESLLEVEAIGRRICDHFPERKSTTGKNDTREISRMSQYI